MDRHTTTIPTTITTTIPTTMPLDGRPPRTRFGPSLAAVIALVTCTEARGVDTDLPLLSAALPEAVVVEWDDPEVVWASFERVIVRSTWDYHRRRTQFLEWATGVEAVAELWNPADLLAWNTDKRYLGELVAVGVPVVPTTYLVDDASVDELAADGGFDGDLVVKPTLGVSANGVLTTRSDAGRALAHARRLLDAGLEVMVQPYLAGVDDHGETALVYLGGEFSHAVRRRVVLRPGAELDGDLLGDEHVTAHRATSAEATVGELAMAQLPPTAYARIDLLPTDDGPVVLEVEVTEPSLFLHLDPGAPGRAAEAFRRRRRSS